LMWADVIMEWVRIHLSLSVNGIFAVFNVNPLLRIPVCILKSYFAISCLWVHTVVLLFDCSDTLADAPL
jgi:hypothetical protein